MFLLIFTHFGDLEIDLQNDLQNDLKMVPLKSGKPSQGSPGGGTPGEIRLRSFWGRFGGNLGARFGGRFDDVWDHLLKVPNRPVGSHLDPKMSAQLRCPRFHSVKKRGGGMREAFIYISTFLNQVGKQLSFRVNNVR